ncbi:hypothetical protein [Thermomonospora amylolytica]|nr:hypothetical protein [Thermomonospora amylolytica]
MADYLSVYLDRDRSPIPEIRPLLARPLALLRAARRAGRKGGVR